MLWFKAGGPWANFEGNVDAFTIGISTIDTTFDFEPETPCTIVCYADAVNGNDTNGGASIGNAKKTIQAAIDAVNAGGEVRVLPGNYNETALNRQVLNTGGIYQFGLFIDKNNVTIQGVTDGDVEITDPNNTSAYITTNATNNFGASGIFVQGDNVTLAGLHIGHNIPGDNKTIEIIGDGFTLKDSYVNVTDGGSVYFNDWQFDTVNNTSHVRTYTIDNNLIDQSTSIDITSGAGYSGPASDRQITNNVFENSGYWPSISFNGSGTGVPWFVQSVGGAVIQGNTFTNTFSGTDVRAAHIRVRGTVDDAQFDWESYWSDNTFNKAVVILESAPFNVRQYNYSSGTYSFDVRRIGVDIQSSIDKAVAGDTVYVAAGTYTELGQIVIGKNLTVIGVDKLTTIIKPGQNTGTSGAGDARAWILVNVDVEFNLSNVTLDGSGKLVETAFLSHGTGVFENNIVRNIYYNKYVGRGVALYGGNMTIRNNSFSNIQRIGMYAALAGTTSAVFDGNTYVGKGPGDWLDYGIELEAGAHAEVMNNTITDAVGVAESDGSTSAALYLSTYFAPGTSMNAHNNILKNNTAGLEVGYLATDGSTAVATHNLFEGNEFGIRTTGPAVTGDGNWWGSVSGPVHASNPGGTGDKVGDNITFTPWLCSGTDTSTDPGFQPLLQTNCSTFGGFSQPIDTAATNIAKAGQTIPVKWRLTDASGAPISDPASFVQLHVQGGSCAAGLPTDAIETYSAGSGLQYLGDGYWQFNWKTTKSLTGCRSMYIEFQGGLVSPTITFQFK